MVYGDGAFKDPVGKIWELADHSCFSRLYGRPGGAERSKQVYRRFRHANLSGDELEEAVRAYPRQAGDLTGQVSGTTPRRLTDLIGSLCDLTSGSGDKGTPIVLVQGYFDNLTD